MSEIYVTGHRNPDTDSIVASMSYAKLRNALGDREYKAVRIGAINDETQHMLDHFGFEPPEYIKSMRTQVCDLDFDRPPELNCSVTMDLAWRTMREGEIATMPIVNDDGTLYGMLSAGDIASYDMETIYSSRIDELPVFNLLSVLEGRIVNECSNLVNSVSGSVIIALPQSFEDPALLSQDTILICGDQPEVISAALAHGVNCLIMKSRYRCYPVLDEDEHVVGTLSRFHLLNPRRKRVVLVDHNEASQSVIGLDQVEIMEIIDHHRLADIQTRQPISVRNEPVGSTCTIITAMYQEHGVMPSPRMAGLMAAAILSDTVMFKSPTCTKRDIAMAERLARIARIDLEELGHELYSVSGADGKSAEELFKTDYKQFHIAEKNLGVSQITCVDAEHMLSRRDEFMSMMKKLKKDMDFDIVILMVTDVLLEGSYLLYVGSDDEIQQAFSVVPKDNCVFLPGVMSRKKQVIPMLTALWG